MPKKPSNPFTQAAKRTEPRKGIKATYAANDNAPGGNYLSKGDELIPMWKDMDNRIQNARTAKTIKPDNDNPRLRIVR